MKKILFYFLLALLPLATMSCNSATANGGKCHITGSISTRWNGIKIFLVPLEGPQDAAHVDSIVIKDGKFEFTKDSTALEIIRVDYHYRDGIQELLVCTEPGEVKVHIGENSTTAGTPQNDSLQVFKDLMIGGNNAFFGMRRQGASEADLKAFQQTFQAKLKAFAARQPEGVLRDYLQRAYSK